MRVAAFVGTSALVFLGGCVTVPYGPTVPVMPERGKPYAQFQREDDECQSYAENTVARHAQDANNRAIGTAILGTALGAGLGAAVGGGQGAAIGAASGAIVGTSVGANDARFSQGSVQGRYNLVYAQCMQSYGNEVAYGEGSPPGYYRRPYGSGYDYPPPPPPGY